MPIMLTEYERNVLAHVLIIETPEEWVARNEALVGIEKTRARLNAKVNRWQSSYETAITKGGVNYKTANARWRESQQLLQKA